MIQELKDDVFNFACHCYFALIYIANDLYQIYFFYETEPSTNKGKFIRDKAHRLLTYDQLLLQDTDDLYIHDLKTAMLNRDELYWREFINKLK